MSAALPARGRTFEVPCTVRVSHTFENLYAHVELDGQGCTHGFASV